MTLIRIVKSYINHLKLLRPIYSYSQEGEDIVLERIFSNRGDGFFVDVGAHHPMRFSNTYKFYKKGWRGINIEPNPEGFNLFNKYRPNDININFGVSTQSGFLKYFMFDEPALNTFDEKVVRQRMRETPFKLVKEINVKVKELKDILDEYVPKSIQIDFMTIDVEGFDFDVIKSNNWIKYRPNWVLVEQLNLDDIEKLDFEIHNFMKSINYVLFAKTFNTLFYKDKAISV
jgi:FkbM family methyltransferase